MELALARELILLCGSLLFGIGSALFFELFCFFRCLVPCRTYAVFIQDLVFSFTVTVAYLFFAFAFSDGRIRGYSMTGAFAGFVLCYRALLPIMKKLRKNVGKREQKLQNPLRKPRKYSKIKPKERGT